VKYVVVCVVPKIDIGACTPNPSDATTPTQPLYSEATKPPQGKKGGQRGTEKAGDGDGEDDHHPAPCKAEFCVEREGQLEALLDKR